MRPRLLDLFAGAGGASVGYERAGFDVVGVDNRPQPHYLFGFVQADALDYLAAHGHKYDVIHASPPCQRWTHGNVAGDQAGKHPDLITPTRALLLATGLPYVIENVPRAPLIDPIVLCGTMFGLRTVDDDGTVLHLQRHRLFESNMTLDPPPHVHPSGAQWAGAYGGARRDKHEARHVRKGGYVPPEHILRPLLDIDWMTETEMFQAIPPAYTQHIGAQLLDHLRRAA